MSAPSQTPSPTSDPQPPVSPPGPRSTFSRDRFGQVTVGRSRIILFPGVLEMTRSLLLVLVIALFILTFIVLAAAKLLLLAMARREGA